jgi:hypothetical protein
MTAMVWFKGLNHFYRLEDLEVHSINGDLPAEIALPSLKTISTNHMTDTVLIAIGQRCAKLESLMMFGWSQSKDKYPVTHVGVRAVLEGCPLLRDTDVKYAVGITTELRSKLTTLRACDWPDIDDALAQEMLKVSPELQCIDVERATWVTDTTLVVCALHCPLLESVTVRGCTQLTKAGVCAPIAKVGSTLRSISVGCCGLVTDEAVLAIACPCPPNTSDAATATLAQGCSNLVYAKA